MGKFIKVDTDLILKSGLSATELQILLALATFADYKTGENCMPAQTLIADYLKVARCTVNRAIKKLEELGFIETSRTRKGNKYKILNGVIYSQVASELQCSTSDTPNVAPELHANVAPELHAYIDDLEPIDQEPLPITPLPPKPATTESPKSIDQDFEEFYQIYPRHVGRGQAIKAYRKARKDADHETLCEAAEAFAWLAKKNKTEQRFIAHPATWLNGQRWMDEGLIEPKRPPQEEWDRARSNVLDKQKEQQKLDELLGLERFHDVQF